MKKAPRKNIVWLHSHFLFWMGGTKFVFEVAKRLHKDKKYRLIVVVEQLGSVAAQEYHQQGIEVLSLNSQTSTSALYWLGLPYFLLQNLRRLRTTLIKKKWTPENTVLVSSMFPMNVIATLLPVRHVQLCYEPFAFFYDKEFIQSFSLMKKIFINIIKVPYQILDRWAVRKAAKVLTLNTVTQQLIQEVYSVGSILVYAGVDQKRFRPFISAGLQRKYRGRKVIIHSTDYSPVKGTDRVLRAMKDVVKKQPKALLIITTTILNADAERNLKLLAEKLKIAKNVEFAGFVASELLPQYYSLAWVLVQGSSSSRSGTTSMALPVKEAMCCETPAIRPDAGGEDVIDGESGFLVDPRNTAVLSEKILTILQSTALRKKMGKNARKTIIRTYTWEKTVKRVCSTFSVENSALEAR